jgi:hypothetical protein
MDYRIAATICPFVVAKLSPTSPPCTPVFQNGEYISPKDGKKYSAYSETSYTLFNSLYCVKKPVLLAQFNVPPPHSTEHSYP